MFKSLIKAQAISQALVTCIAMCIATLLSLWLHLGAPYWSSITVIAIMSLSQREVFKKGLYRVVGTIVGAIIGCLLVYILQNNFVLLIFLVFLMSFIGFVLIQYSRFNYAVILGVATTLLIFASMVYEKDAVYLTSIWRTAEITIGVISAAIISYLFSFNTPINKNTILISENKILFLHALKAALAITLSVLGWLYWGWPGGLQGIISSIIILTETEFDMAVTRAFRRLLGCAIGGGIGIFCLHFIVFNIYDLLFMVLIFGFIFSYFSSALFKNNYISLQANVAFSLALIQAGGPTLSVAPSLDRLSGIVLGILSSLIVSLIFYEGKKNKMDIKQVNLVC